jgi:hypothetical protein
MSDSLDFGARACGNLSLAGTVLLNLGIGRSFPIGFSGVNGLHHQKLRANALPTDLLAVLSLGQERRNGAFENDGIGGAVRGSG